MKKTVLLILLFEFLIPAIIEAQFYNRNTYRTQRHEISLGFGASSCLTDIGGGASTDSSFFGNSARGFLFDLNTDQTKYVFNFSYMYYLKSKITFRINLAYSQISGDDKSTSDPDRNNRKLNFETTIVEGSGVVEWILVPEKSGNRYNLKNKFGKSIGAKNPLGFGLYAFGGIGIFYYDPYGYDYFQESNTKTKHRLRPLRTEGQGIFMKGSEEFDRFYVIDNSGEKIIDYSDYAFNFGETYKSFSMCFPVGFGIKKSFHSTAGLKLEAGFRFTRTDYLDDVSTRYFNQQALRDWHTPLLAETAAIMSGTNTGETFDQLFFHSGPGLPDETIFFEAYQDPDDIITYGENAWRAKSYKTGEGQIRGNPLNFDSYMFLTLSAYKKFKNTQKSFRVANSGLKRKIKASF